RITCRFCDAHCDSSMPHTLHHKVYERKQITDRGSANWRPDRLSAIHAADMFLLVAEAGLC
ncbi:MAG TPA: hypothetical protein VK850_11845, partial [Candidatus Binatia bacterium]|nr:hypothetical protein [Candidatus Binatia bacterium]